MRLFENRLILSASGRHAFANTDIPASYLPATSYDLVNLYLAFKPTQDLTLNLSVENLLNQYYRPYAIPVGSQRRYPE